MSDPPRVVVLCPRRAGMAERDRLWGFVRAWWARDFPRWPIYDGDNAGDKRVDFNRSAGLNAASDLAGDWDVAVCIDGDVLIAAEPVRAAVALAWATGKPVLAYHERCHLSQNMTEKILNGYMGDWRIRGAVKNTYYDSTSSAYVVRRDLWDTVGGFDEAFVGWGWEDIAFRCATETMAEAELVKIAGTLYHLHHVVSEGNNRAEPTFQANKVRGERYIAARFDPAATAVLLDEAGKVRAPHPVAAPASPTRIPRILHRSVPAVTTAEVEGWWSAFAELHPRWELRTYRDPLDPAAWPMTGDLHAKCDNGAQLAGLVRLEALYTHGGVYVDSDVQPYRSLEPLTALSAFAGYEDRKVCPDAVLGCEPRHPAWAEMIDLAREAVYRKRGAWESGPGVTTKVLPGRDDVLLLPPGSFFPYSYKEKQRRGEDHKAEQPWAFMAHHWAGSWLPPT